jgi:hypothetical protein
MNDVSRGLILRRVPFLVVILGDAMHESWSFVFAAWLYLCMGDGSSGIAIRVR